jgi:hypothetical protein
MILQMGMSTQLLFTAIITLMKVAILLTYLRKYTLNSRYYDVQLTRVKASSRRKPTSGFAAS